MKYGKIHSKSLYCILYGKIGDSIHYARVLDVLHRHNPALSLVVLAKNNVSLVREVFAAYPFITVLSYSWKTVFIESIRSRARRTHPMVLMQFLFGVMPWRMYVKSYAFARAAGGTLAAFVSGTLGKLRRADTVFPFDPTSPYIENFAAVLACFGVEKPAAFPPFQFSDPGNAPSGTKRTVVIFPFAAKSSRTLPEDRWYAICAELASRLPNHRFVIIGGREDEGMAKRLALSFPAGSVMVYAGLPISAVAHLIKTSGVFLGVDSGITHLAASIETSAKRIVVGNLSNPSSLPRYNPDVRILTNPEHCICSGDFRTTCSVMYQGRSYLRCMFDIPDEEIIQAVTDAVAKQEWS